MEGGIVLYLKVVSNHWSEETEKNLRTAGTSTEFEPGTSGT